MSKVKSGAKKIGIFSGTFDPVHGGHIAFALSAAEEANLDELYFLPEMSPRRKNGVTHYAHRLKMLELALKPHRKLKVMELPDKQFSVSKTLPRLNKIFPKDELFLLVGSDVIKLLASSDGAGQWPGADRMLKSITLIVGTRGTDEKVEIEECLKVIQPNGLMINSDKPFASSRDIRSSLMRGQEHDDLLASIKKYIASNWLYVSLDVNNS